MNDSNAGRCIAAKAACKATATKSIQILGCGKSEFMRSIIVTKV
jgi:hypothetical protein